MQWFKPLTPASRFRVVGWSHLLQLENVLLAVDDLEASALDPRPDVARVKPPVRINSFSRLRFVLVVTLEGREKIVNLRLFVLFINDKHKHLVRYLVDLEAHLVRY